MSYISVVLVPVFKNQKDYWWVSLIIIGAVLLAYPLYVSQCPAGLSDKDRIAVFTKADDGKVYTAVTGERASEGDVKTEVDTSNIQLTEV